MKTGEDKLEQAKIRRELLIGVANELSGFAGPVDGAASLYDRAAKVALHELGHLFNLQHCDDSRCLMHFNVDIADLQD